MGRRVLLFLKILLAVAPVAARGQDELPPLLRERWFEARTAHFNLYSCGNTQQVAKLAARLEQFRQAYSFLAATLFASAKPCPNTFNFWKRSSFFRCTIYLPLRMSPLNIMNASGKESFMLSPGS